MIINAYSPINLRQLYSEIASKYCPNTQLSRFGRDENLESIFRAGLHIQAKMDSHYLRAEI